VKCNKGECFIVDKIISQRYKRIRIMAGSFRDLTVHKKEYVLMMEIFEITKKFHSEEKYELTDQTRRSSRSVGKNTRSFVTSRKK
jgi:hypothetical protein